MIPLIKRLAKALWIRLPMAGGFFLLSMAYCFSVPSPYALCCLAALLYAGIKPKGAVLGLMAGFLFRVGWNMPLDQWQFIACLLCWPMMMIKKRGKGMLMLLTGPLLILRTVPGLFAAQEARTVILLIAGALLGLVSLPALHRAAGLLKAKKQEWSEDDLLCMLLPLLLMISGAGHLVVFGMNLGYLISCFAVLLLAWLAGGAVGLCGGMGCGLALLLGGQGAQMLVNLTFGALIAGLFQGKKRILSMLGFYLGISAAGFLSMLVFQPLMELAGAAAGLIFLLLPEKPVRLAGALLRRIRWSQPRENAYTRLKMQRWVRAIDQMADALPHPKVDRPDPREEGEALAESLCQDCDQLPICWHEKYAATKEGMLALAQRGEDPENYLKIINQYFTACPRISKIPPLLEKMDEGHRKRTQRAICAEYERDMLQTHLAALSQAAQQISLEGMQRDEEEIYWHMQVEEVLQSLRFPGKASFIKKVDGRMHVCLKYESLSLRSMMSEQLVRHIGARLNARLSIVEQKEGRILMEEEAPLIVYTGMATACAAPQERKQRSLQPLDNGDAVLARPLPGGKMLLALSDGMGHGAGAREESKKTLELLSLCMEAGYSRSQAMTAVNGAMLSATGGEQFATVDLCLIDLWTGEAAMNKLGACASVLFMGRKMQWIEGEALPLGIIEHVIPMEHHFMLGEGDVLLMMSDGVTDAFAAEEEILSVLQRGLEDTPQHIADALLQAALIQKDGMPPDDMTVLCARVELRHPERKKIATA